MRWIPRRATTPDGKGCYGSTHKSQSSENGFPAGRLHQTEGADDFQLKKVKALEIDSMKGDHTRRKGLGFVQRYIYIYIYI